MIDINYGRVELSDQFSADQKKEVEEDLFHKRMRRSNPGETVFSEQELRGARLLWPTNVQLEWNAVDVAPGTSKILVHPLLGETTVAILGNNESKPITKISALVSVDHPEANEVEFGLAVVHKRRRYDDVPGMVTDWNRLSAGKSLRINGTIEFSDDNSVEILLATRMHDGADPKLAWAYFSEITVCYGD